MHFYLYCVFGYLYVCVFVYVIVLSICLSICISLCICISTFIYLFVYVCIYLPKVLDQHNQHSVSILDKLEVEQKRKSKDNVNRLLKRLSLNRMPHEYDADLLNQSIPDHFEMMKHQDSINEKRPSLLMKNKAKALAGSPNETIEEEEHDTQRILDKVN